MTFNLRRDFAHDGPNAWTHRLDAVAALLRSERPHVLGTQEGLPHQLAALDRALDGYSRVGSARCGRGEDEANAIYFDTTRLDLRASGDFWLSDRPHEPGSRAWGSACPRLVTWARFRDRATGRDFTCANTHLDHISEEARVRSAALLAERFPHALLLGDFNAEPGSPVHAQLTAHWVDTHAARGLLQEPGHTYHGFTGRATQRIDWILVPRDANVLAHRVLTHRPEGRLPSDHWPVAAEILL